MTIIDWASEASPTETSSLRKKSGCISVCLSVCLYICTFDTIVPYAHDDRLPRTKIHFYWDRFARSQCNVLPFSSKYTCGLRLILKSMSDVLTDDTCRSGNKQVVMIVAFTFYITSKSYPRFA